MGLFTRRGKAGPAPEGESPQSVVPEGEPGVDRDWDRRVDGPFDVSERPDVEGYVDFGALRIPPVSGMTLRMDVESDSRRVVGVTCGIGESTLQVQAFAAPRSEGIWDGIRAELAESIRKAGGALHEQQGLLGTELLTKLPSQGPDDQVVYQNARFYGVDGPTWFLRLVVHGPGATQHALLRQLLAFARGIVVDRGQEPRPPRELLDLTPPPVPAHAEDSSGQTREDDPAEGAS
ncbi:MAG: DUF3710 domain-containing protein [Ornithinimicrobium sp.]